MRSERSMPVLCTWTKQYGKPLRPVSPYPAGRCRTCNARVSGRRKAYCSDDCAHEWSSVHYGRNAPHWLRMHTFIRDNHTCQDCGAAPRVDWWMEIRRYRDDPMDWFEMLVTFGHRSLEWDIPAPRNTPTRGYYTMWTPQAPRVVGIINLGKRPDWPKLEMHHVLPVSEGGDDNPDNLITLCRPCHLARHGAFPRKKLAPAPAAPVQHTLL